MFKFLIASLFFLLTASIARADAISDCDQNENLDRRVRGCTALIKKTQKMPLPITAAA